MTRSDGDETIRHELEAWVKTSEPPFSPDTSAVRRRARRTRRLQAAAAAVVCVVVAVGALVVGQTTGTRSADPVDPVDPVTERDAFDPAAYEANLGRLAGTRRPYPAGGPQAVTAYDGQGYAIEGDDRRYATRWQGQFQVADGHALSINMLDRVNDPSPHGPVAGLEDACRRLLAEGTAVTCDVEPLPDGYVQYLEVHAFATGDAWPLRDRLGSEVATDHWIKQVVYVSVDGRPGDVTEVVRTSSVDEARARFSLTRDELIDLALDPSLRFPSPPRNAEGCEWTVAHHDGPGACDDVRPGQVGNDCDDVDEDVFRTIAYDFDPAGSLDELLDGTQLAVAGVVEGFEPSPLPDTRRFNRRRYAAMRVEVTDVLAGDPASPLLHDGVAYVPVHQGAFNLTTSSPLYDLASFERAVPRGTRVVLLVGAARPEVQQYFPDLALAATSIQGLLVEECGVIVGGLEDFLPPEVVAMGTYERLTEAIREAGLS